MTWPKLIACIGDELLPVREFALGVVKNFKRTGKLWALVFSVIAPYGQDDALVIIRNKNLMRAGAQIEAALSYFFAKRTVFFDAVYAESTR